MSHPRDSDFTVLQLLISVTSVLVLTAALTSPRASHVLLRAAPALHPPPPPPPHAKLGDLAGTAPPEPADTLKELSILDKGLRGHNSNFGWLPADPREEERDNVAPPSIMSVYLRMPHYDQRPIVKAVVFYGRRQMVHILNCYLERNLLKLGGLLTEVLFVVNTAEAQDLAYLDVLMKRNTEYKRIDVPADEVQPGSSDAAWRALVPQLEPSVYYLKLDDDIVFVQDTTVASMLAAKLRDEFHLISADVVNHGRLTWVHAQFGVLQGFQAVGLPSKRWVPTPSNQSGLEGTAAERIQYMNGTDCAVDGFQCAAIAHYSLFDAFHRNHLRQYDFGLWDWNANMGESGTLYEPWHMHMVMFRGSDLNLEGVNTAFEQHISVVSCRDSERHCGAVGRGALAAHFAYAPQVDDLMQQTDVLEQYGKIARSMCWAGQMPEVSG